MITLQRVFSNVLTILPLLIVLYFLITTLLSKNDIISKSKLFIRIKQLLGILLIVIFIGYFITTILIDFDELKEINVYVSLIQAFLTYIIVNMLISQIGRNYNDHFITNFNEIITRYSEEVNNLISINGKGENYLFPNKVVCLGNGNNIKFIFNNNYKAIDNYLHNNGTQIAFEYHNSRSTKLVNEPLLRLEKFKDNKLEFNVTTHLDKVITNWSADFKFKNAFSIRDLYEPGPYLTELEDALMSNGIGFNMIIKTEDDKFIISRRNKSTLVSNNNFACSLMGRIQLNHFRKRFNIKLSEMDGEFKNYLFTFIAEYLIGYYLPLNTNLDEVINNLELLGIGRDLITAGTPQLYVFCDLVNIKSINKVKDENFVKDNYKNNYVDVKGEQALLLKRLYNLEHKKFNKNNPLLFKKAEQIKFKVKKSKNSYPEITLQVSENNTFKDIVFTPSEMAAWAFLINQKDIHIEFV